MLDNEKTKRMKSSHKVKDLEREVRRLEQENDDEYTHQRSKSDISNFQFLNEGNGYNMTQITRNDLEAL